MSHATVSLYESGQLWTGLLRRTLQPSGVRVEQEGSWATCSRRLLAGEVQLAAIEVQSAQVARVLALAEQAGRYAAPAGVIVLATRELAPLQSSMLEAGVLHCEFSPRNFHRLGEVIQRWLAAYAPERAVSDIASESPWPPALTKVMDGWNAEL